MKITICPAVVFLGLNTCFHSQMLWGLFFPALMALAGELGMGLGPFTPHSRPPPPRCPSLFITAVPRETCPLCVSVLPTSLDMTSSCPYLEEFCSANHQVILSNGGSVTELSLDVAQEEASSEFTCSAIFTRNCLQCDSL